MAGLLDFLSSDDAQLGLGLLAAAGPSATPMSLGQRLAQGVQIAQQSKDGRLRNKLLESQIAENTSQDALRRAQLERQARQDAYYMGSGFGAAPAAGTAAATGAPGGPAGGGTAPAGAGAALKAAAGAPPDAPPPGQGKFAEWSKQYGIPVDALVADYFSNGGKGIADMLFKRGTPNMQVQNGYAVDMNRVQPGFLPSLNTSQDGKSTLTLIDPATGLPNVMPTPGAVGAFGAFQEAGNRSAANYQPERVIDPTTGQTVVRPRSDVLQPRATAPVLPGRPLGAVGPGYAGGSAAAAAGGQAEILNSELQRATQEMTAAQQRGDTAAAARAQQDVAGIQRELQRLPGAARTAPLIGPGSGVQPSAPAVAAGNVVELSPQQQAQNEASRRFQTGVAEAAAGAVGESRASAQSAAQTLANVEQIRSGIDKAILGPGANVRVSVAQIGQMLGVTGKDNAEQLSNTRNVIQGLARQELAAAGQMKGQGQITENERAILRRAEAGDIGNFTKPELVTLLGSLEKTANYRLQAHNNLLQRVQAGETPTDLMSVRPPTGAPAAPAAAPAAGGLPPGWTVKVR